MSVHARLALIAGHPRANVRLTADAEGRIAQIEYGVPPESTDVRLGTVLPGAANTHSHAFHRALRGRTHGDGGDFWHWRESMYRIADILTPELYERFATGVFAEMLAAGYTAVGEFHYVHHRPDGRPYDPPHAMERALAAAAHRVGIRLTLLDTIYLEGGIGRECEPSQRRFSDGDAASWARRWRAVREALPPETVLGAAIHSVRAVPPAAIAEVLAAIGDTVPLHIHLSEQPQENAQSEAAWGCTPTSLLESLGALSPRLTAVHATHLSAADITALGERGVSISMCPSTEADLGDGIGPARALADAGARITLGSDQNAVIDPLLEARGLEAGERLASGQRGRFTPAAVLRALAEDGYAALGRTGGIAEGAYLDLCEITTESVRTVGALPAQLPFVATASDITRVIVGGEVRVQDGRVIGLDLSPAAILAPALEEIHRAARGHLPPQSENRNPL